MSTNPAGKPVAVIAGAGPAGLTAALELLRRSRIQPLVFDADAQVGGISKTVNYRGNRMDLGGHRFFSKSDWVMRWWQEILPVATDAVDADGALRISYQRQSRDFSPSLQQPTSADAVMLVRQRLSRIFYRRRFFDYPLKLNAATLGNMGLLETLSIGLCYGHAQVLRRAPEDSLEDFFVNRFGDRLYRTFFKDYTEKVWGVPCQEISAEWGAQRIKGLSVTKALAHAVASPFRRPADTAQKRTETSLIERFLYPKFGPGQMWEEVARRIGAARRRDPSAAPGHRPRARRARTCAPCWFATRRQRAVRRVPCDDFVSTMPVRDLTAMLEPEDPQLCAIADGLPYRDFMTAGLLLRRMARRAASARGGRQRHAPRQLDLHSGAGRARSAGCRCSTTGAPRWSPIRARFGWDWSISAARATSCGPWTMPASSISRPRNSRKSA